MQPEYAIHRAYGIFPIGASWEHPCWREADTAGAECFHPQSSEHRPTTNVRLLYDAAHLYGIFQVRDRYVLCKRRQYQEPVYRDACVEFFVQPRPEKGYFNFEMNCCGTLLLRYVEDPARTQDGGLAKSTPVPPELASGLIIHGSLDGPITEEIAEETWWYVSFAIPLSLLETFVGALGDPAGQTWRGNFYKCADDSSHPHWASWAPIGEKLNFHQPEAFGTLRFV